MDWTILHLHYYIEQFYYDSILKPNKFMKHVHSILTVLSEEFKIVFFAFWGMKNFAVFPARFIFPVKFISCINFGSASSACSYLKYVALNFEIF